MNKKEVQKRVLQDGSPLPLSKFEWDEKTNTFSSKENYLVLDFNNIDGCMFKTSYGCTFRTGSDCTFRTGSDCTFDTGSYCTFKTSSSCTFKTSSSCTFDTGSYCTFECGEECVAVRRDIYEIIEVPENTKIKLNEDGVKGYTKDEDKKVTIQISEKSLEALKESGIEIIK